MSQFIANTNIMRTNVDTLQSRRNYYSRKSRTFYLGSYQSVSNLSSYLGKIQASYLAISRNIGNVIEYLNDYIIDIEAIEKGFCGNGVFAKTASIGASARRYSNSLDLYKMSSDDLFEIRKAEYDIHAKTVADFIVSDKSQVVASGSAISSTMDIADANLGTEATVTQNSFSVFDKLNEESYLGGNEQDVSSFEKKDLENSVSSEYPHITIDQTKMADLSETNRNLDGIHNNAFINDVVAEGMHLTTHNPTYSNLPESTRKMIEAVVASNSNGTYEDALGVASVILNRYEDGRFPKDFIEIISDSKQFGANINPSISNETPNIKVIQAVDDALNQGIRNNDYLSFESYHRENENDHFTQMVEHSDGNFYYDLAQHLGRLG